MVAGKVEIDLEKTPGALDALLKDSIVHLDSLENGNAPVANEDQWEEFFLQGLYGVKNESGEEGDPDDVSAPPSDLAGALPPAPDDEETVAQQSPACRTR